jgi:hypothetical protein
VSDDSQEEVLRHRRAYERAKRAYAKKIQMADQAGFGPGGIELRTPLDHQESLAKAKKQASLEFFGELLFGVLDGLKLADEDLAHRVNPLLVTLREITLKRWPAPMYPTHSWREQKEMEFDAALIQWLESTEEWRKYETRVVPHFAVPTTAHDYGQEHSDPLLHFLAWPLEKLPTEARRSIRRGLLEIHGKFLDRRMDVVESWRATYDLVADAFDGAKILSEDSLKRQIPEVVADAAAGGGWSCEPLSRTRPTGIFSVRFGSQFYQLWRLNSFLQALSGRTSYWSGRLVPDPSPTVTSGSGRGRKPKSAEHREVADFVAALGKDWKSDTNLKRLAEWMDSKGFEVDRRFHTDRIHTWADKLEYDSVNFLKAIQFRLRRVKR